MLRTAPGEAFSWVARIDGSWCSVRVKSVTSVAERSGHQKVVRRSTRTPSTHHQMAVILGKRKRRAQLEGDNTSHQTPDVASEEDLKAAFQRAFEAKFKPLRNAPKPVAKPEIEEQLYDGMDEESDWEGFDSGEEVEVIQHAELSAAELEADRKRKKAFLVSPAAATCTKIDLY